MAGPSEEEHLHRSLLTDISIEVDTESENYDRFLEHMKTYKVPRAILSKNRNNVLKLFESLESQGLLRCGKYDALKSIAEKSGHGNILELILKAEIQINALREKGSTSSSIHGKAGVSSEEAFKKPDDDTLSEEMVGKLKEYMQKVGALVYRKRLSGTVFRVGSKYVMTAYHVVEDIVGKERENITNLEKDVFVTFDSSLVLDPRAHLYKLTSFLFFDIELDFALLEIRDCTIDIEPFKLSTNVSINPIVDSVSLIGYGHPQNGDIKHLDPKCRIIDKADNRIKEAEAFLMKKMDSFNGTNADYFKLALKQVGHDPSLVDLRYNGYDNQFKFILNAYLEHGASGSPVFTNKNPNDISVVGLYTSGIPKFYFSLPNQVKVNFKNSYRFEMATRMDAIYADIRNRDTNLANDIFRQ